MSDEIKKDVLDTVAGGETNSELYFYYTVKEGDTLSAIAHRFGTTRLRLCQLNPIIQDENLIHTGWRLVIPRT